MTCKLCPKVAIYEVPPNKEFFCGDHKQEAYDLCKKTARLWDRVHYPESIGGYTFSERIWMA